MKTIGANRLLAKKRVQWLNKFIALDKVQRKDLN